MSRHDLSEDRRFCRAILPDVSRTFALSIQMLAGSFRESVAIAYLLCRTADTLEDSMPGSGDQIRGRFVTLLRALDGDDDSTRVLATEASAARRASDVELVTNLPRVLAVYRSLDDRDRDAVRECLGTMCEGMSRY